MDTQDGQTTCWIENNLSLFLYYDRLPIFFQNTQLLHKKLHKANVGVQSLDCLHFSLRKREVKDLQKSQLQSYFLLVWVIS